MLRLLYFDKDKDGKYSCSVAVNVVLHNAKGQNIQAHNPFLYKVDNAVQIINVTKNRKNEGVFHIKPHAMKVSNLLHNTKQIGQNLVSLFNVMINEPEAYLVRNIGGIKYRLCYKFGRLMVIKDPALHDSFFHDPLRLFPHDYTLAVLNKTNDVLQVMATGGDYEKILLPDKQRNIVFTGKDFVMISGRQKFFLSNEHAGRHFKKGIHSVAIFDNALKLMTDDGKSYCYGSACNTSSVIKGQSLHVRPKNIHNMGKYIEIVAPKRAAVMMNKQNELHQGQMNQDYHSDNNPPVDDFYELEIMNDSMYILRYSLSQDVDVNFTKNLDTGKNINIKFPRTRSGKNMLFLDLIESRYDQNEDLPGVLLDVNDWLDVRFDKIMIDDRVGWINGTIQFENVYRIRCFLLWRKCSG